MKAIFKLILSIYTLLFIADFSAKAQQVPLLDQYYINPVMYNPAASGATGLFNAFLLRNQKFTDFEGGQVIHVFTADAALKEGKHGVGLNLMNDNVGLFNNSQAMLSYAHQIKIADRHNIRFGISAGISDFRINMSEVIANANDPYLSNTNFNNSKFMANLGVYYSYKNLLLGLSIPQLLNNTISNTNNEQESSYKLKRQMLISSGYKFPIKGSKELSISPFVMLRYATSVPFQYDLNLIADLKNKAWFALSYRDDFSMGLNLGVHVLKNFTLGYSYDIGIKKTGRYASNNHEFLIGYRLPLSVNKKTERVFGNDNNILKTLLAEKYKKIDYLRKVLEEMEQKERQLDKDRDGVADNVDKCPNTPSYYIVNETGCPVDSDADGIVDSEDLCPEIPGSYQNKGCPEEKEEKIEMAERLENIYFLFGKHSITEYSRRKLESLINILKKNKHYMLKMHGHTDDIGSNRSNIELAHKRLVTVKNYLCLHGIPSNQIIIVPHGESMPLVANTDSKSRANNRRVSFEIYNYQ